MTDDILKVESLNQIGEIFHSAPPTHPLIKVIRDAEMEVHPHLIGQKMSANLYTIGLKENFCGLQYGVNAYTFEEGNLAFTAPHQVAVGYKEPDPNLLKGWVLFFHPELLLGTDLGQRINQYPFFSYSTHQALILEEAEGAAMNDFACKIQQEAQRPRDPHTDRVLVSLLELLLHYSERAYYRQFPGDPPAATDLLSQVEAFLKTYFAGDRLAEEGMPTIQTLAEHVHLTPGYLSALLKKETGQSAKDHINSYVVEKAKSLLLSSSAPVSEVAHRLGFNYPHYFSRFFKARTGHTPQAYRKLQ